MIHHHLHGEGVYRAWTKIRGYDDTSPDFFTLRNKDLNALAIMFLAWTYGGHGYGYRLRALAVDRRRGAYSLRMHPGIIAVDRALWFS